MSNSTQRKFEMFPSLCRVLPGLAVSAGLAALGILAWILSGRSPVVSPMIAALVIGVFIGNIGVSGAALSAGNAIAMRPILRTGIVLLGFRLTLGDLAQLGTTGLVMVVI
ncbi:MAG: putative sulfate exporter family transporter, partial [Hyphomicrobiaceae bacterium]